MKQHLFTGLVRNPPKTVAEFMSEATTLEKTLNMRSGRNDRPPSSVVGLQVDTMGATSNMLRESIPAVVREEVRKLLPTTPQPQFASSTDVIREEVQQALGTSASPETPHEP